MKQLKLEMYKEAEELNFERAAEIRDEISKLEKNKVKYINVLAKKNIFVQAQLRELD